MAGKRAPELAAGELMSYFDAVWDMRTGEFLASPSTCTAAPELLAEIEDNLQSGRATMHLGLATKCDFWGRLPWILCGLGHTDETTARKIAAKACDMFAVDPRQEAHHRLTWAFMRPGSQLRSTIDNFVNGTPRCDLPLHVSENLWRSRSHQLWKQQ